MWRLIPGKSRCGWKKVGRYNETRRSLTEAMMKMEQTMNERVIILDEPVLQFAGGHYASDPHDGLALFGPYGQGTAHHCSSPPYIVVGTPFGLNLWDTWSTM